MVISVPCDERLLCTSGCVLFTEENNKFVHFGMGAGSQLKISIWALIKILTYKFQIRLDALQLRPDFKSLKGVWLQG